jgi:hypothetical protein
VAAAAVAVGLAGVLAVLPLYVGWWELGRTPSLNPLETGVAMGAPLLLQQRAPNQSCDSGSDNCGGHSGGQRQQQQQQQQQRSVNSNGGHAHIETRVGALRVRYCAIPAVDEDEVVDGGSKDEDGLAKADTLRGVDDDAVIVPQTQQQQESNQQLTYTDGDVELVGSGKGMRLRLVDEQQMLRRRVKMVKPRKGEMFL